MFYTFNQNNSGGRFHLDKDTALVMIFEAPSAKVASALAEDAGLYFNGCEDGIDCECCGDRWHHPWNEKGDAVPSNYGTPITQDYTQVEEASKPRVIVHMLDGTKTVWMSQTEEAE